MKRTLYSLTFCSFLLAALGLAWTGPAGASDHKDKPRREGILLAAFGTTVPEAQKAMDKMEARVKAAFPGLPVRWAYTSKIVRDKLAAQGHVFDSPEVALARMADEGFTKIGVMSLHTIPGEEYTELARTVRAASDFSERPRVVISDPLLHDAEDMDKALAAILAVIPKERQPSEAVVLMGHGTPHPANVYYMGLQYLLSKKAPGVFVGTVEGSPTLRDVQAELKAGGFKTVWLMPFMSVAGDHALNDMAGAEDDSWKSILTKAGHDCRPVLKGTAEYDEFGDLWVEHLKRAMADRKHP
ncbi:MAG: sirohydrochlorin cobaltochelatase [Pseudomonadota bacterium]